MNRKTLFTLILLIVGCLPFVYGGCGGGGGSSDDGQVYVEEPFFYEVTIDEQTQLRIQSISGSIEIAGSSSADSVTVAGERRVGSDNRADAEVHLDELQVEVNDLGTEVFIETIQPKRARGRNYIVDYRITIPDNLEVYVSHIKGPVFVDTIDSQVNVNTVNGDVDLVEIIGSTRVNVINGRIISQIKLPLDGTIELSIMKGRIDSEIRLLSDGTIDMRVLEGSINLDIPQDTSATFAADVVEGDIRLLNLDLQDQVRTSHSLTGTLGNGRGDIVLETDIGSITVNGF